MVDQTDQSYQDYLRSIVNHIDNYDVDGIHLDYVRYSGDESKNLDLAVSAALMPQMEVNTLLYAQDYTRLADYLDFIVPMIYRGTFKQDNAWIV